MKQKMSLGKKKDGKICNNKDKIESDIVSERYSTKKKSEILKEVK